MYAEPCFFAYEHDYENHRSPNRGVWHMKFVLKPGIPANRITVEIFIF